MLLKGTNFDRPEFQRMIEKVRSGEVVCIIVKDLSRFSRDYIEMGTYLEQIFPFLGIRFISVTDHYDSKDYIGKTADIIACFLCHNDCSFHDFIVTILP